MLLRYLFGRRNAADAGGDVAGEPFRWRGEGVSRIEGLSDTVFGFAITLLVVSLDVPKTSGDLLTLMSGFVPFVASFAVLFALWRAQFEFFRRYGLEDTPTVRLTGLLLIGVLFAIYPVKFLFTFMLLVLPGAILYGHPDTVKQVMQFDHLPRVLALYGAGFLWVTLILSRMYAHAYAQRISLALTELEAFDTKSAERRWLGMSFLGLMIVAWCFLVMATGAHLRARDDVFWRVYAGGLAVVFGASMWVRFKRRATTRARRELVARHAAGVGATAPID
jgi:uncharacterized membrane protein